VAMELGKKGLYYLRGFLIFFFFCVARIFVKTYFLKGPFWRIYFSQSIKKIISQKLVFIKFEKKNKNSEEKGYKSAKRGFGLIGPKTIPLIPESSPWISL